MNAADARLEALRKPTTSRAATLPPPPPRSPATAPVIDVIANELGPGTTVTTIEEPLAAGQPIAPPDPSPLGEGPTSPQKPKTARQTPIKRADAPTQLDVPDALSTTIPRTLRDRLRAETNRRGRGITFTDLLLEAVSEHATEIGELLDRQRPETTITDPVFGTRVVKQPHPRTPTVQVIFRAITQGQRQTLEDLAQQHGANSLAELITATLDAHLPPKA